MASRDCVIGYDVGTGSLKASVFDFAMHELACERSAYGLIRHPDGRVEQDPGSWLAALREVTRKLVSSVDARRIAAVACSSQGGTFVALDADARPVGNAISWLDSRGLDAERVLTERVDEAFVARTTGWQYRRSFMLAKLRALREDEPDFCDRIAFVGDCASFVNAYLGGRLAIDPSAAAMTQLFDVNELTWSAPLLERTGFHESRLPQIVPSGRALGTLAPGAASDLGLEADTLVVSGGHDQYCAALGAAVRPGGCLLSCGTAWVVLSIVGGGRPGATAGAGSPGRPAEGPHVVAGLRGRLASLPHAGGSLQWVLDSLVPPEHAEDAVELAAALPVGSDGVRFERAPSGEMGFSGLREHHDHRNLVRAVMEWVADELAGTLEAWAAQGISVERLVMTGGAVRAEGWAQIVADRSGRRVEVSESSEFATRGAAVLAVEGVAEGAVQGAVDRESRVLVPSRDPYGIALSNLPSRRELVPAPRAKQGT